MRHNFLTRLLPLVFILTVISSGLPLQACDGGCPGDGCVASFTFPRSTITADTLQSLLKSGAPVKLLESRLATQKKNVSIPGATVIRSDDLENSLQLAGIATTSLVIVYPALEGGAVASLTMGLREIGCQSVLEYSDGVLGWMTFGYEVSGDAHE